GPRGPPARERAQPHPGPPRFRESDRASLLGRPRPVLPLSDVVHLFAAEFGGLGARRLARALVSSGSSDRALFRHLPSPLSEERCPLRSEAAPSWIQSSKRRATWRPGLE